MTICVKCDGCGKIVRMETLSSGFKLPDNWGRTRFDPIIGMDYVEKHFCEKCKAVLKQ